MNRLCPACDREILADLVDLDGGDDVVELAGEDIPDDAADWADMDRATFSATVRLSCSCSYHDVETDAEVSAFDYVPDEWDYDAEGDA